MLDIPVLIVGGGPAGLSASVLLSQHGVGTLLVERHPGTSIMPKARHTNSRTMEIYRQCGMEDALRAAGLPAGSSGNIVSTESLAGREIERRVTAVATPRHLELTPTPTCLCAQDDLEPVIRRFARSAGPGELRFDTELTDLSWDTTSVTAALTNRKTGIQTAVRARYLIAADGAQSRVRRRLGVRMVGEESIYDSVNLVFHADLRPWTAHRPAALYFVEQPTLRGTFLTSDGVDRWGFLIHSLSLYGFKPEDFTPERCIALIRQAAGVPDLEVSVQGVSPWEASAIVAERYRHGPIFLAGDAAHEMPPTGGFGLNTGVQDVHNLAWKLAAVLQGRAGETLLDTYHAERQPVAVVTAQTSLANAVSLGRTTRPVGAVLPRKQFLNENGLLFGVSYDSAAVIPDGSAPPALDDPITDYVPSGRPGGRAPHVWLQRGGLPVSTIDLFGPQFVLLAGPQGGAWMDAARRLTRAPRPPLHAHTIGGPGEFTDPDDKWLETYGLQADGAVLVRPDGHVAWRSPSAHPAADRVLTQALDTVLCRTPQ